jgi:hypothetical protein
MPKKVRSKSAPKKKTVHPLLAKAVGIFAVIFFAGLPILVGLYYLAMALGGFLYNNQEKIAVPPLIRGVYGFDMPPQAKSLIQQGLPEDVIAAYKVYGDAQYELGSSVMPVAYGSQSQKVRIVMGKVDAVRGAWKGSQATLTFSSPGAAVQGGPETRTEDWKDSITGRVLPVYPWATYQVTFDESALHTYLEAEAALDVTYAHQQDSGEWQRETVTFTRPLRFYVVTPEELEQIHTQMPYPDNIRLPLVNPLNPVFWGLILLGSGIWILRTLRQSRVG